MQAAEVQNIADGYVRPVAFRGSEMMAVSAQQTKIHVAIAVWPWPSYFDPKEKLKGIRLDLAEWRRPAPNTAPCKAKAAGLYMICTISKHAAEAKGYADAVMFDYRGLRRRGDGRQRLLRQGWRAPHAHAGLLPRRHHPPFGGRAGRSAAAIPGHPERAIERGRNDRLRRMLHHRHRCRSDAGFRNRSLPLQARTHHRAIDA